MPENIAQLGAVAIIFSFAIKEFFGYLKNKKQNGNGNGVLKAKDELITVLKEQNSNHLSHIESSLKTIADNSAKQIEILSRIDGRLDK